MDQRDAVTANDLRRNPPCGDVERHGVERWDPRRCLVAVGADRTPLARIEPVHEHDARFGVDEPCERNLDPRVERRSRQRASRLCARSANRQDQARSAASQAERAPAREGSTIDSKDKAFAEKYAGAVFNAAGIKNADDLVLHLGHRSDAEASIYEPWQAWPALDLRMDMVGDKDFSPTPEQWWAELDAAMKLLRQLLAGVKRPCLWAGAPGHRRSRR